MFGEPLMPYEFAGWLPESLAWHKTAYIHAGLSGMLTHVEVKGPDLIKLFSDISVNRFDNFDVGKARHVVMCNERGNIMQHGMAYRVSEDAIRAIDLAPYLTWKAETGGYNVTCTELRDERFIFQIAGPKSLEIIEQAAEQDIHDLGFMRFMITEVANHKVEIVRMGMGGSLSYEIQGTIDGAHDVWNRVVKAGEAYGIQKLGILTYVSQHTENGFPQWGGHFPLAWAEDQKFAAWTRENLPDPGNNTFTTPIGTYSKEQSSLFVNPIMCGWSHIINFNHDFIGKAALEAYMKNPKRLTVTTVRWNPEDVLDIYASYLQKGKPFKLINFPVNFQTPGPMAWNYQFDKLTKDNNAIGFASWPIYTHYYRDIIEMAFIEVNQNVVGKEVILHWGDDNHPTKEVRATIERFPYLDLTPNKDFDVEKIPHYKKV
jgi:glycine cleavage system aminomethyltransferase T